MVARPRLVAALKGPSRLTEFYAFLHHTVAETEVHSLWGKPLFVLNTVPAPTNTDPSKGHVCCRSNI